VTQDGQSVARVHFTYLQFDATKDVRVPSSNSQHIFIEGEAFDVSGLKPGARQQEFHLIVIRRDGNELMIDHDRCSVNVQAPGLANDITYFGQEVFLLRRRKRYGAIERGDANNGGVEV